MARLSKAAPPARVAPDRAPRTFRATQAQAQHATVHTPPPKPAMRAPPHDHSGTSRHSPTVAARAARWALEIALCARVARVAPPEITKAKRTAQSKGGAREALRAAKSRMLRLFVLEDRLRRHGRAAAIHARAARARKQCCFPTRVACACDVARRDAMRQYTSLVCPVLLFGCTCASLAPR